MRGFLTTELCVIENNTPKTMKVFFPKYVGENLSDVLEVLLRNPAALTHEGTTAVIVNHGKTAVVCIGSNSTLTLQGQFSTNKPTSFMSGFCDYVTELVDGRVETYAL